MVANVHTKKLVEQIVEKQPGELKETFNKAIFSKLHGSLESRKKEIAEEFLGEASVQDDESEEGEADNTETEDGEEDEEDPSVKTTKK